MIGTEAELARGDHNAVISRTTMACQPPALPGGELDHSSESRRSVRSGPEFVFGPLVSGGDPALGHSTVAQVEDVHAVNVRLRSPRLAVTVTSPMPCSSLAAGHARRRGSCRRSVLPIDRTGRTPRPYPDNRPTADSGRGHATRRRRQTTHLTGRVAVGECLVAVAQHAEVVRSHGSSPGLRQRLCNRLGGRCAAHSRQPVSDLRPHRSRRSREALLSCFAVHRPRPVESRAAGPSWPGWRIPIDDHGSDSCVRLPRPMFTLVPRRRLASPATAIPGGGLGRAFC